MLEGARPGRTAAAEGELALANTMRELHPCERHSRRAKGLKGEHWRAATLDSPMILLNDIVEVSATAYLDGSPLGTFLPQQPQCSVTGCVAIDIELSRPSGVVGLQGLAEEGPGRRLAAISTQQGVDSLAVLVDGAIQVVGTPSHRNRSLIHPPG
jgi:hypothetical protein